MAQEKVRVDSHVAVKMRDGVTLYADIYDDEGDDMFDGEGDEQPETPR